LNLPGKAFPDFNAELFENFTWDGLALIKRDSTNFVNESAVTGGNPILAFGKDSSKVLFEDMLGSTVGSVEGGKFNAIDRSAFGESKHDDNELNFFTGKPQVEGLGYAFLFRNYRAEQGKWQTADPMGFPDGWNNLAYCNNMVTNCIDWQGTWWLEYSTVDGRSAYTNSTPTRKETGTCTYGGRQCIIYTNTTITYSFPLVESYCQGSAESGSLVCIWVYNVIKTTTIFNEYEEITTSGTTGQVVYVENPPRVTTAPVGTVTLVKTYIWIE
jgi:RHS repeat-associated protein